MSSWLTTRKDRKGRTVYVLRTKNIGPDGKITTTQRAFGCNKKKAEKMAERLNQEENSLWGAGFQVSKKTRELTKELDLWLAGRSDSHIHMVKKAFTEFINEADPPMHLVDIKPSHIDKYKKVLLDKGLSPFTIDKRIRNLRLVFKRAKDEGYLARCPVITKSFLRAELPERVDISFVEMAQFFSACDHDLEQHVFFRILAVTGIRSGELGQRDWDDVDLESRTITLRKTKTKKVRQVPIDTSSNNLLYDYWLQKGCPAKGQMFPSKRPAQFWGRRCKRICAAAGLKPYTPHNFRHSLRPRWRELRRLVDPGDAGKLDYLVGEVLVGHQLRGVGETHYDRIDIEEIREAVEIYGAWIDKEYRLQEPKGRDTDMTQPLDFQSGEDEKRAKHVTHT